MTHFRITVGVWLRLTLTNANGRAIDQDELIRMAIADGFPRFKTLQIINEMAVMESVAKIGDFCYRRCPDDDQRFFLFN